MYKKSINSTLKILLNPPKVHECCQTGNAVNRLLWLKWPDDVWPFLPLKSLHIFFVSKLSVFGQPADLLACGGNAPVLAIDSPSVITLQETAKHKYFTNLSSQRQNIKKILHQKGLSRQVKIILLFSEKKTTFVIKLFIRDYLIKWVFAFENKQNNRVRKALFAVY